MFVAFLARDTTVGFWRALIFKVWCSHFQKLLCSQRFLKPLGVGGWLWRQQQLWDWSPVSPCWAPATLVAMVALRTWCSWSRFPATDSPSRQCRLQLTRPCRPCLPRRTSMITTHVLMMRNSLKLCAMPNVPSYRLEWSPWDVLLTFVSHWIAMESTSVSWARRRSRPFWAPRRWCHATAMTLRGPGRAGSAAPTALARVWRMRSCTLGFLAVLQLRRSDDGEFLWKKNHGDRDAWGNLR